MSLGLTEFEIIIGRQFSLWLDANGLPLTVFLNEFNLLTNNVDEARPLYTTQTFEISIEKNEDAIAYIKAGGTDCQIFVNSVLLLSGSIQTYSENLAETGSRTLTVSVISGFKSMSDYMGNNSLFLDAYDFSSENFIIGTFSDTNSTDLMKFGRYLPIDKTTGTVEYSPSAVNDYCQPSICKVELFKRVFEANGWTANWDIFSSPINAKGSIVLKNVCLIPIKNYLCSSFGFNIPAQVLTIPANSSIKLPLIAGNLAWNTNNGANNGCLPVGDGTVQVLQPVRLMQFKIVGNYTSNFPFTFSLTDGVEELLNYESIGNNVIRQYTDWIDPALEGLNPIYVELKNNNSQDVQLDIQDMRVYNLFSIYESDQYESLEPQGYYYPIQDNYNDNTILELFKDFLIRNQIALSSNDSAKSASFYFINNIFNTGEVDLTPKVLWDGYLSLGASLEGLAKLNAVRYKNNTKKQFYFKIDIANLPSNDVYFESIFLDADDDKNWLAMSVPSGEYKVKIVDAITSEYLNYKEISPMIGYYTPISAGEATMVFAKISLGNIIREFWSNIILFLTSTKTVNPTMYELKIKAYIYEFLDELQQKNMFYYQSKAIMVGGSYDVMKQEFTGKFLSLQ